MGSPGGLPYGLPGEFFCVNRQMGQNYPCAITGREHDANHSLLINPPARSRILQRGIFFWAESLARTPAEEHNAG